MATTHNLFLVYAVNHHIIYTPSIILCNIKAGELAIFLVYFSVFTLFFVMVAEVAPTTNVLHLVVCSMKTSST